MVTEQEAAKLVAAASDFFSCFLRIRSLLNITPLCDLNHDDSVDTLCDERTKKILWQAKEGGKRQKMVLLLQGRGSFAEEEAESRRWSQAEDGPKSLLLPLLLVGYFPIFCIFFFCRPQKRGFLCKRCILQDRSLRIFFFLQKLFQLLIT